MEEYTQRTYGEEWAAEYDSIHGELDPTQAVETLVELAGGRPVLELAIGTGRIALPLKERGVEIHGVDISDAMVAQLRKKPGGEEIPVTMGNFADADFGGEFSLILLFRFRSRACAVSRIARSRSSSAAPTASTPSGSSG